MVHIFNCISHSKFLPWSCLWFVLVYWVITYQYCLFYLWPLYYSFDSFESIIESHPCPCHLIDLFIWIVVHLCCHYSYRTSTDPLFFSLTTSFHSFIIYIIAYMFDPFFYFFTICIIEYLWGHDLRVSLFVVLSMPKAWRFYH